MTITGLKEDITNTRRVSSNVFIRWDSLIYQMFLSEVLMLNRLFAQSNCWKVIWTQHCKNFIKLYDFIFKFDGATNSVKTKEMVDAFTTSGAG